MRTVRAHTYGAVDDLVVEDISSPVPEAGEALIEVDAAGVNFADALMVAGKYQLRPDPPFAPGFEAAGTVKAVGPGVEHPIPGTRVLATPPFGCYAEQVVVPVDSVMPLPDSVESVTAVATAVTFGTAYHGLVDRVRLTEGETLVVTGATGGVGSAAMQVGLALGARVVAAVGRPEKADAAREMGAHEVIGYDDMDGFRDSIRRSSPRGNVDVVFDTVGGDVFDPLVRSLAIGGRFLVVGFASGKIPRLPVNLVLLKESAVVGVFWGAFRQRDPVGAAEQLGRVWSWLAEGRIALPPIVTAPLDEAAMLLTKLMERRVVGKAVVVTGGGAAAAPAVS